MGARPGLKCAILETGMSDGTRSKVNKDEVEDLYKTAIEPYNKPKNIRSISTPLHTSTPKPISKQVQFIEENSSNLIDDTLIANSPEASSDDSASTAATASISKIVDSNNFENNPENSIIMAQQNPFVTLKYAVDAVPFFDGSNIPLNYFIEGCEEAKSMLPKEAEPQFTKILRTRIVGEARRTIQDQDFDKVSQLTAYLKRIFGPVKPFINSKEN